MVSIGTRNHIEGPLSCKAICLGLGGRDVADGAQEALVVTVSPPFVNGKLPAGHGAVDVQSGVDF